MKLRESLTVFEYSYSLEIYKNIYAISFSDLSMILKYVPDLQRISHFRKIPCV